MLLRWLLGVFPRELRAGWNHLAADAPVWCGFALVLTVLAYADPFLAPAPTANGVRALPVEALANAVALVRAFIPPLVFVVAAARFSCSRSEDRSWAFVRRLAWRRTVPALIAWSAASATALGVSLVAQLALIMALSESGGSSVSSGQISSLARMLVFTSVLARFAFVPFLVVLERRDAARPGAQPQGALLVRRVTWPLSESWARTQSTAWPMFPYVFLAFYAPVAAAFLPAAAGAPAAFVLQLLSFTALAVIFDFYSDSLGAGSEHSSVPL
jgi:hypothetical protein